MASKASSMIEPCNSESLWIVDSVDLRLSVGEDQRRHPDSLFLCVRQCVHVDVRLHVVQLQPEVVPSHVEVELVAKDLPDFVDVQNLDQVDRDQHLDLQEDTLLSDSEGSIVRSVVARLNHQRAIVLVREVVAVGELVAALLHRDASAIAEAGELLEGADGHEGGEGVEGVGETDVLVKLPGLGSGAYVCDRCHTASVH